MTRFIIFFVLTGALCMKDYVGQHTPVQEMTEAFRYIDADNAVKALEKQGSAVHPFLKKLQSAQVKGDPEQSAKNILGIMDSTKKDSGKGSGSGSGSSGELKGNGYKNVAKSLKGMDGAQKAAVLSDMISKQRQTFDSAFVAEAEKNRLARNQYAPTSTDTTLTDSSTGTTTVSDPNTGLVTTTEPSTGLTKIYNPTTGLTTIVNTLTGVTSVSDQEPPPYVALVNPIVPKNPITSANLFADTTHSSSSRPTLKTVTTVTQEKTQEELDKKALIKQKVEERSKNIEKKTVTQIFNQCSNGACCDTKTGKFRPIGTTCRASECAGASVCLGVSGHCPPAPPSSHLPVGTACTGGHCHSGVCVKDTTKDRRKARVDELKAKRVAAAKKDATDSGPPVVFGLNVVMECTHGGCCDLNTGLIKPSGSRCTFSKHECFEATGTCNGYESKCGRKAMADDTLCDDGKGFCKDGTCVLSSLSAQTNTHTTSTESTEAKAKAKANAEAKAKAKEEETDFVSDEIATRNEELDLNMAELEAKIEKAKSRQKTIKATMMQQEQEENKRALRTMFDHIHKFVKQEHTLAKQSLYPYQTTTTKEETLDNARSGFNIHDFVHRIAEEDYRYNRETLARANEKLKANNGSYEQFPWYAAALFGVFVVAVAVIVGIVKTAKSGKKQRTIKDEEYENF